MRRIGLRNTLGRKPKWRYIEERGAQARKKGHGGIDWYRYQEVILKKKLIPFAQEHKKKYSRTIVQEDGAPAHTSKHNAPVFSLAKIKRLLWPGNSPDLNAIEPAWWWMKLKTTKKGVSTSRKELEKKWLKCWEDIEQSRIRRWVERIKTYIQQIVLCEGGNKYIEGSTGVTWRRKWRDA
jgi:transposase